MKSSNSPWLDFCNTRLLKLIPKATSMYMTHLINLIIRSKTYPRILKVLLLLKQGKSPMDPSGYRPISNLSVFDKLIQEWFKNHLVKFLEDNNVILPNHHGGLKGHGTLNAKNHMDYLIGKDFEKKRTTVMLNTDMSAAFDSQSLDNDLQDAILRINKGHSSFDDFLLPMT